MIFDAFLAHRLRIIYIESSGGSQKKIRGSNKGTIIFLYLSISIRSRRLRLVDLGLLAALLR